MKSDSRWGGVQVGLRVPDSFGPGPMTGDDIRARCVRLGVSAVELNASVVETFLGVPVLPACSLPMPADGFAHGLHPLEEEVLQDEVDLAERTLAEHRLRWRAAVSLDPLRAYRHGWDNAGVAITSVYWAGLALMQDDEVDYCFRVGKALGLRALCTEMIAGGPRRLGPFADRHELLVGFQGDAGTGAADFAAAFSHGRCVGAALDIDEWVAGGHGSPLDFLAQHHDRITQVVLTKRQEVGERGAPFGAAAAMVRQVLAAMRNGSPSRQVTVSVEHPGPAEATGMAAIASTLQYCRSCLTA